MVLEILCVEPLNPQYSGVLETCLALRYWFFEVLGSESVKFINGFSMQKTSCMQSGEHISTWEVLTSCGNLSFCLLCLCNFSDMD